MNWKKVFRRQKTKSHPANKHVDISKREPLNCRNCGTEYKGNYCPHCGQTAKEINKPFSILIYDFMGTVFAFDARFFKTLKAVLFYPGKFSTDYMDGKRASYMKPFQFYVFVSFVFFLLLNIHTGRIINSEQESPTEIAADSTALNTDTDLKVNGFAKLDSLLQDADIGEEAASSNGLISISNIETGKKQLQTVLDKGGHTALEKRILTNSIKILSYPKMFISKTYKYISWSFFIVMPFYAFLLWALYHRKRKFYAAHFIYALNTHATAFLIFILIMSVKLIFPHKTITPENWGFWLFPIYTWLGMRKYYGQSKRRTTFKFLLISFVYGMSILLTLTTVFIISVYF